MFIFCIFILYIFHIGTYQKGVCVFCIWREGVYMRIMHISHICHIMCIVNILHILQWICILCLLLPIRYQAYLPCCAHYTYYIYTAYYAFISSELIVWFLGSSVRTTWRRGLKKTRVTPTRMVLDLGSLYSNLLRRLHAPLSTLRGSCEKQVEFRVLVIVHISQGFKQRASGFKRSACEAFAFATAETVSIEARNRLLQAV